MHWKTAIWRYNKKKGFLKTIILPTSLFSYPTNILLYIIKSLPLQWSTSRYNIFGNTGEGPKITVPPFFHKIFASLFSSGIAQNGGFVCIIRNDLGKLFYHVYGVKGSASCFSDLIRRTPMVKVYPNENGGPYPPFARNSVYTYTRRQELKTTLTSLLLYPKLYVMDVHIADAIIPDGAVDTPGDSLPTVCE